MSLSAALPQHVGCRPHFSSISVRLLDSPDSSRVHFSLIVIRGNKSHAAYGGESLMVRPSYKLILSCTVLISASAIAGCSSSSSSKGPSAGTTSTGQSAAGGTQGKTIFFVPGVIGNAFYLSMECSIREEAKQFGFEI